MTHPTTAAATNAKPAKDAAAAFQQPKYEMPKFDTAMFEMPRMEVPEAFRAMTEKGVAQAKGSCDNAKAAAIEAANLLQSSYMAAAKGATDYNLKLFGIVRANTEAGFGFISALLGTKSPAEFAELSTTHTREQLRIATEQTKELAELAQKLATETVEPLKSGLTKSFAKFAPQGGQ